MPVGSGGGSRCGARLTAERSRRAALFVAVAFPGTHLFLWFGILPTLFAGPPGGGDEGDRWVVAAFLLGFGALGAFALWLPTRAMERATMRRGVALLAWAALYATLVALAATEALAEASGPSAAIHGLALWLYVPLTFLLILTGGLIRSPELLAGLYVAALTLGGALTLRAAGVDGGGDRR